MEFHEAANIFPLDEGHLQELADDINAHGQLYPVEIYQGKILDGRRRWKACKLAGVEPETQRVYPDDPVAYVVSLNLHRRHLSITQLGACAARAEKLRDKYAAEAKDRQRLSEGRGKKGVPNCAPLLETGKTRDRLADTFGVSHGTVARAKQAMNDGIPELAEAMEAGKISANQAAKISGYSKPVQKEMLSEELTKKQPKPPQLKDKPGTKSDKPERKSQVLTESFAVSTADVAMTQLKAIPVTNQFRIREFDRVQKYLAKEMGQ